MIRALINFLLSIRKLFMRWGKKGFEKVSDPETGKIKGISPQGLKRLLFGIITVFFLGVLITQIFTGKSSTPSGIEGYQKEMEPKLGIGEQEQLYKSPFGEDPMSILNNRDADPLAGLGGGKGGSASGDGEDVKLDEQGNRIPDLSECLDLIEKLKSGAALSAEEQKTADICIEKNIAGLSAEELAAAKALLAKEVAGISGSKTDAEKELIKKLLNNDLDPDSAEARLARGLINNEAGARDALAAMEAKNKELMDALLKQMDGGQLSADEKAMIDAYKKLMEEQNRVSNSGDPALSGDKDAQATELARRIAEEEQRLKQMAEELARAQREAAQAGERLARGEKLTDAELAALQKLADLQKRMKEQDELQKKRREQLAKLMNQLNTALLRINKTIAQVYPSGISVEMAEEVDCNKIKPLKFKKIAKKGTGKGSVAKAGDKEVWLDMDGQPLDPDKIRLIKLYRKQKSDLEKAKQVALNPANEMLTGLGGSESLNNTINAEESGQIEIGSLRIFTDKALKSFNLTPDMKIAGVLDSEILISDKGNSQMVRVRILADVHNPDNNQLIIPKGAIAIAQTSGFDADVGTIDLSFDKVSVGSGKVLSVKLQVGSADGTMGLRGQVRDTRGKYLLGAFITSFTAGALNWFSQEVVQPFQTETDAGNALTGAALAGGAEVMTKIAEIYAGDLQNAAKIFYVPKGVPIILFPQ